MKGADWEHNLLQLREKFNSNTTSAKVIPLRSNTKVWYRVAAVLLISSVGVISYQAKKKQKCCFS
ncbi:MAG: hypothetical protein IPJ81_05440 [Chitinophagaceae bacterium]|nr:hypothetical protein [Chitinophagaceae bacterium]